MKFYKHIYCFIILLCIFCFINIYIYIISILYIIYIYIIYDSQREKKCLKIFRSDAFFSYLYKTLFTYLHIYTYTYTYIYIHICTYMFYKHIYVGIYIYIYKALVPSGQFIRHSLSNTPQGMNYHSEKLLDMDLMYPIVIKNTKRK